jgi:hypothetical protein
MTQKNSAAKTIRSFAILAVLCTIIAVPTLAVVDGAMVAVLNVVPTSDPKVVTVMGSGFDQNEPVYLALTNATTGIVMFNFTETVATNGLGVFTKDITLPPGVYGVYNIYARTSNVAANKVYNFVVATNPKIAVSPPNSNIFKVSGSGFNPVEVVVFNLVDNRYASAYNFTDVGVTDTLGNFTVTLIVPTTLSGNYTLIASTRTGITLNTPITLPNLIGPKGDTGETGDRGPKGPAGTDGASADNALVYVAVLVSVLSAVVSVAAILRTREPDDDDEDE